MRHWLGVDWHQRKWLVARAVVGFCGIGFGFASVLRRGEAAVLGAAAHAESGLPPHIDGPGLLSTPEGGATKPRGALAAAAARPSGHGPKVAGHGLGFPRTSRCSGLPSPYTPLQVQRLALGDQSALNFTSPCAAEASSAIRKPL